MHTERVASSVCSVSLAGGSEDTALLLTLHLAPNLGHLLATPAYLHKLLTYLFSACKLTQYNPNEEEKKITLQI